MKTLYFNHAGTSWPKPDAVIKAVHDATTLAPHLWSEKFNDAHQELCNYFNIDEVDQLLLTPGCTSALATAIADINWQAGDVALHTQWEHHAVHRPLMKLQGQGVIVQGIPVGDHGPVDLHAMEELLKQGKVKLVAFTAASNVTGEILPIEEMIRLAHEYAALALVDAAQVVGWMDIDFQKLGADIVAFGSHKGLLSPWGIGGLYIAEHVPMQCISASCDMPTSELPDRRFPRPGYCAVGSVDQFTLAGLQVAIRWLNEQDLTAARMQGCAHALAVRELLERFEFVTIHTPRFQNEDRQIRQLPTIAFSINDVSSSLFAESLASNGLIVSGGYQCAPVAHATLGTEKSGVVRISFGIQQRQTEVTLLLKQLDSALRNIC